jgi:hypothetical protein
MTNLSKQVAKVVQVARNRNTKQVIDDLMQMYCNLLTEPAFIEKAFPNTLYRFGAGFRQELTYYKKDLPAWYELTKLSQMFLQTVAAAEPFTDHMGSLYDLELRGNTLGQFLTPPDLAELIGDLHMSVAEPITNPKTIGDDTGCGAGSLILGLLRAVLTTQGKGAVSMLNVVANDLDPEMAKICAVQIVMNSCIHRIPVHSLTVHNCNVITEYMEMQQGKHIAFQWLPNTNKSIFEANAIAQQALKTMSQKNKELETA